MGIRPTIASDNLAARIQAVRSRPLSITKVGEPEAEKTILVHRCHNASVLKPDRCTCTERISLDEAHAKIQADDADWVRVKKQDGSTYTFRKAIVLRLMHQEIKEIAAEQKAEHAEKLQERRVEHKNVRKLKNVGKAIAQFRKALTPEENRRWTNEDIHQAFLQIDTNPAYLNGIGTKKKLDAALDKAKENGSLGALIQSQLYREMADAARIHGALLKAAVRYTNIYLSAENLSVRRGEFLTDAPKGCGKLIAVGDGEKLATIDAHREENQDGTRKCTAANFVPGSGDAFDGQPIYNSGQKPDVDVDSNDYEVAQQNQEAAGLRVLEQAAKNAAVEIEITAHPARDVSADCPGKRDYTERDVFDLEDRRISREQAKRERAADEGISVEEIEALESVANLETKAVDDTARV